jgi:hypothetical protein
LSSVIGLSVAPNASDEKSASAHTRNFFT